MVKEVEEGEARVVKPGVVGFDGRSELAYILLGCRSHHAVSEQDKCSHLHI